jgi:hypothetical protein
MRSLLEEARVVDNPSRDGLTLLDCFERVPGGVQPDRPIVPLASPKKIAELAVHVVGLLRIGAGPGRDRLGALAFPVAEYAERVQGERFPLSPAFQVSADATEELFQSSRRCDF